MTINKEKYIVMDGTHPLYTNNRCFDPLIANSGPGHSFLVKLSEKLQNSDIGIITSDIFLQHKDKIKKAALFSDQITPNTNLLNKLGAKLSVNISLESPIIARKFYHKLKTYSGVYNHSFHYGGTFNRLKESGTNFHNIYWPVNTNVRMPLIDWDKRENLIMIASNKRSVYRDFSNFPKTFKTIKDNIVNIILKIIDPWMRIREIYSDRIEAIKFFSKLNKLDLYGIGWDKKIAGFDSSYHRCAIESYRGPVSYENKIKLLNKYKFAICFENCPFPGYITEKIFDCILSGCIPIYFGAPDISEYIPYKCYIDYNDFKSFNNLNDFLENFNETKANYYLDEGYKFLISKDFKNYDENLFVDKLIEIFKNELN